MACDYVPEWLGGLLRGSHLGIASEPVKECRLSAGQWGKTLQRHTNPTKAISVQSKNRQEKEEWTLVPAPQWVRKKLQKVESQKAEMKDLNLK